MNGVDGYIVYGMAGLSSEDWKCWNERMYFTEHTDRVTRGLRRFECEKGVEKDT